MKINNNYDIKWMTSIFVGNELGLCGGFFPWPKVNHNKYSRDTTYLHHENHGHKTYLFCLMFTGSD